MALASDSDTQTHRIYINANDYLEKPMATTTNPLSHIPYAVAELCRHVSPAQPLRVIPFMDAAEPA